jgi:hypothetical protein
MLKKIEKEMDEFASGIKTLEGHDKLLDYINSSIYASIKLLIFASKTFSIYGRVLFFIFISLNGIVVLSALGIILLNTIYPLIATLIIFVLIIVYVIHFRKSLILYIDKSKKNNMDKTN